MDPTVPFGFELDGILELEFFQLQNNWPPDCTEFKMVQSNGFNYYLSIAVLFEMFKISLINFFHYYLVFTILTWNTSLFEFP